MSSKFSEQPEGLDSEPSYIQYTIEAATMIAHFVCILLTGFVAYVAKPGYSLFPWHPTMMMMAFTFFMMEGILLFSPHSSILQKYARHTKVTLHWITMVVAIVCMIIGQLAITINKEQRGKAHLTTWHSMMGALTVLYSMAQALGGVFQTWSYLQKMLPNWMTLGKLKVYHATSGLMLYLLAFVTIFLGMFSNWFTRNVTGTLWYACATCPVILLFVVSSQVTRAYITQTQKK